MNYLFNNYKFIYCNILILRTDENPFLCGMMVNVHDRFIIIDRRKLYLCGVLF